MTLRRNTFIRGSIGAGLSLLAASGYAKQVKPANGINAADTKHPNGLWEKIRSQFNYDYNYLQMTGFLLASHPKPVRDAIEYHRDALDRNPSHYIHTHWVFDPKNISQDGEQIVVESAARYLRTSPELIALTDSTTAGLALLYSGLRIKSGQEILTTEHDHFATHENLRLRELRTGVPVRKVRLYTNPFDFTAQAAVQAVINEIRPATRVIAVTWVHSNSGIKFPVADLAMALRPINVQRDEASRILLCVDGVHGLGVENIDIEQMGCDFFAAGTHKWLLGPRGTGIVWGKRDAWQHLDSMGASFSTKAVSTPGRQFTVGGFHSFEHRWALNTAFDFHSNIGKQNIQDRIHGFATLLKNGLMKINKVKLMTPLSMDVSSGMVIFRIQGLTPEVVVSRLEKEFRIIASTTPVRVDPDARLAAGLMNTPSDVYRCLVAVERIAQSA